ncbi:GATA zinc finger domain-containing protein 14-like [Ylistrum balloti]|uniref:GATA zinc finger domain-containing protein 14-like n=1 Tax=Ylistrum balloti TaxID=509963 RepID=UPI002905DB65|nr:GATA zinc finger domain-containing protein 14-like [Ylistrum balloti]
MDVEDTQTMNVFPVHSSELYRCPSGLSGTMYTYNGQCYRYVDSAVTWDTANAVCSSSNGGHLVVILDQATNDFIMSTVAFSSTTYQVWIGFTDRDAEQVWKWVTGEGWNYDNWDIGYPVYCFGTNELCPEDCAYVRTSDGEWREDHCNSAQVKYQYICHYGINNDINNDLSTTNNDNDNTNHHYNNTNDHYYNSDNDDNTNHHYNNTNYYYNDNTNDDHDNTNDDHDNTNDDNNNTNYNDDNDNNNTNYDYNDNTNDDNDDNTNYYYNDDNTNDYNNTAYHNNNNKNDNDANYFYNDDNTEYNNTNDNNNVDDDNNR